MVSNEPWKIHIFSSVTVTITSVHALFILTKHRKNYYLSYCMIHHITLSFSGSNFTKIIRIQIIRIRISAPISLIAKFQVNIFLLCLFLLMTHPWRWRWTSCILCALILRSLSWSTVCTYNPGSSSYTTLWRASTYPAHAHRSKSGALIWEFLGEKKRDKLFHGLKRNRKLFL